MAKNQTILLFILCSTQFEHIIYVYKSWAKYSVNHLQSENIKCKHKQKLLNKQCYFEFF
jgi:hypothetical protein